MKKLLLAILLFFSIQTLSFGASFDCEKASTKFEHLICDNPKLSKLDEDLGNAYGKMRDSLTKDGKILLKKIQLQWLKSTQKDCESGEQTNGSNFDQAKCVIENYKWKIDEFESALAIKEDVKSSEKDQKSLITPSPERSVIESFDSALADKMLFDEKKFDVDKIKAEFLLWYLLDDLPKIKQLSKFILDKAIHREEVYEKQLLVFTTDRASTSTIVDERVFIVLLDPSPASPRIVLSETLEGVRGSTEGYSDFRYFGAKELCSNETNVAMLAYTAIGGSASAFHQVYISYNNYEDTFYVEKQTTPVPVIPDCAKR